MVGEAARARRQQQPASRPQDTLHVIQAAAPFPGMLEHLRADNEIEAVRPEAIDEFGGVADAIDSVTTFTIDPQVTPGPKELDQSSQAPVHVTGAHFEDLAVPDHVRFKLRKREGIHGTVHEE